MIVSLQGNDQSLLRCSVEVIVILRMRLDRWCQLFA